MWALVFRSRALSVTATTQHCRSAIALPPTPPLPPPLPAVRHGTSQPSPEPGQRPAVLFSVGAAAHHPGAAAPALAPPWGAGRALHRGGCACRRGGAADELGGRHLLAGGGGAVCSGWQLALSHACLRSRVPLTPQRSTHHLQDGETRGLVELMGVNLHYVRQRCLQLQAFSGEPRLPAGLQYRQAAPAAVERRGCSARGRGAHAPAVDANSPPTARPAPARAAAQVASACRRPRRAGTAARSGCAPAWSPPWRCTSSFQRQVQAACVETCAALRLGRWAPLIGRQLWCDVRWSLP